MATLTFTRTQSQSSNTLHKNQETQGLNTDGNQNEDNLLEGKVETLRNATTPVRPKDRCRGIIDEKSLNDIHDVNKGVKRTLVEYNGQQLEEEEDGELMEIGKGGDLNSSVGVNSVLVVSAVSKLDQGERSRSGTPPNYVPEAKRIRLHSPTNSKQQQQTTQEQQQQDTQVSSNSVNRTNPTQTSKQQQQPQVVPRQTSYITSSIRFTNNKSSPTVVTPEPSNKFTTSSSDSVRPVCLWENCMR